MDIFRDLSRSNVVPSFARGMSILVVDCDTSSLMYLASILEQYSYRVTTTELARVALLMVQADRDRFKLVIANVNMPNVDCFSFLHEFQMRDIPVILLSSQRIPGLAATTLAKGATFFLEKPINANDLKYVWQHVFKMGKHSWMVTNQQDDRQIFNHIGNAPMRTNSDESRSSVYATSNFGSHRKEYYIKKKLKGVAAEAVLGQSSKEGQKQGGSSLISKRMLVNHDDKGGNQKEKRRKSNSPSNEKNLSINVISSYDQEQTDASKERDNEATNKSLDGWQPHQIIRNPEQLMFTDAVSSIGDRNYAEAQPNMIHQRMNVTNLTQRQVASHSHLQTYNAQMKKISEASTNTVPVVNQPAGALWGITTGSSSTAYDKSIPLTPLFGSRQFGVSGVTQGPGAATVLGNYNFPSDGNMFNAGKSAPASTKKKSLEANYIAALAPPADLDPLVCPFNDDELLSSSEFSNLMKLLEEDSEVLFKSLDSELNLGEDDRYCDWLSDALHGENEQTLMEPHQKQFNF